MSWNFLASYKKSARGAKNRSLAGFGLVELLVSISIITIVMTIIFTRQGAFNTAILLRSQAYDIALTLREAQLSAISAEGEAGEFRNPTGVFFERSNPGVYKVFNDNDNPTDGFQSGEPETLYRLDPRFEISDILVDGASVGVGGSVSVVYERPNFDAVFFEDGSPTPSGQKVEIVVSLKGASPAQTKTVEVTDTGQIAVLNN